MHSTGVSAPLSTSSLSLTLYLCTSSLYSLREQSSTLSTGLMKMVKVIVGLMGSSAASGSSSMNGTEQLRSLLATLKKHDIRDLDTARVYNKGQNEEDLGGVPEAKSDFSIATKAPGFSDGSLAYQKVIDNCHASLEALKQKTIDLYYFHGPDSQTPLSESCRAIGELHEQGKIARFGVSNVSPQQVDEIHSLCSQNGWITPTIYQGPSYP